MPSLEPFVPDRALYPFESRWFQSDVGQVHYIDEGSGPPILFLHGNPTWSFLYRGIVIRLRKRFRCIAPDYPGFGLSVHPPSYGYTAAEHADVVTELVRQLALDDLTIMGQDWGGPIGMRVALNEHRRMRCLVMGNTWYWPVHAWHMKAFAYAMSSAPLQHLVMEKNLFVERIMPRAVKHPLAPEVLEHYRECLPTPASRMGVAEFSRQILGADSWLADLAAEVPRTLGNVPLLLTWGVHDIAFSTAFMERFRQDFKLVKVLRLDARHLVQEDAPGEISEAIDAFLGERPLLGA